MIDLPPQTTFPPIEALEVEGGGYVFRDEAILGTRMHLNLVARNYADAQAAAIVARIEIDRLNSILNSRDPDSELSMLNRSSSHSASPELFAVVTLAERWRTETNGAYSGRLGLVLDEWQRADRTPSRETLARLAQAANRAHVGFDSATRIVTRPDGVEFALDALAKGWIVDRAFDVAINSPGVSGALVDIGGDIRCGGKAPDANGWCVGIPDARSAVDNAPLVAIAQLSNHAIATSGRGPRDLIIDGTRYSPTLSPHDGWPIEHHVSVSALASTAAEADVLATALLVMSHDRALKFAEQHDVRARITTRNSVAWTHLAQASASQARFVPVEDLTSRVDGGAIPDWPKDWQALATFTAPRRQLLRDPNFRSPYMAMWITDPDNRPVRTLIVVGKRADWQKDNFIWWSINREKAEKLVSTRSVSTSGAGVYNVFWDGVDDRGQTVPAGNYVLHVETSRERGKHTHRSLALSFNGAGRFVNVLPPTEEGGGLRVSFDHY